MTSWQVDIGCSEHRQRRWPPPSRSEGLLGTRWEAGRLTVVNALCSINSTFSDVGDTVSFLGPLSGVESGSRRNWRNYMQDGERPRVLSRAVERLADMRRYL